ncbi:hypothetical protein GCM10028777_02340 [Angustibacter speluncae]
MPSDNDLSRSAEAALDRLAARYAEHLHLAGSSLTDRGRHASRPEQTREANAVVDMVAVAEAFSIDRLLDSWPSTPPANVGTWKKRQKAWLDVGADLTGATSWAALMGYVEVRNALQHGLGRLTDQQMGRRDQTLTRVAASGVDLNGDRVTVRDNDVDRCYCTCRNFVHQADKIALGAT